MHDARQTTVCHMVRSKVKAIFQIYLLCHFSMAAGKWLLILKLEDHINIWDRQIFYISPTFCVTWLWTWMIFEKWDSLTHRRSQPSVQRRSNLYCSVNWECISVRCTDVWMVHRRGWDADDVVRRGQERRCWLVRCTRTTSSPRLRAVTRVSSARNVTSASSTTARRPAERRRWRHHWNTTVTTVAGWSVSVATWMIFTLWSRSMSCTRWMAADSRPQPLCLASDLNTLYINALLFLIVHYTCLYTHRRQS